MKYGYNPERIKKAEHLFSEIIALDEKLPADARIDMDFSGSIYGQIHVWFFERNEEGVFKLAEDMPNPMYFFINGSEDTEDAYGRIKSQLLAWEKRFCK